MSKLARKFKVMDMRVKGFYGSKARWWMNAMQYDKKYNGDYSSSQKTWAYKNGFLPEIAERYGVNDSNKADAISVYDYAYLYPVNDIFRKWIKDRVTTRNVLKPYKQYLPDLYYHLYMRDGEPMIIKLADCPEGYEESFESILQMVRDKKKIYFARTTGFIHDIIRYEDGTYYFNATEMESEQMLMEFILRRLRKSIRVIMPIDEEHPEFFNGTEGRPTVLRLMVYNKYADNPRVGQAYLRYYTAKSVTDDFNEMGEQIGDNVQAFKEDDNNLDQHMLTFEHHFLTNQRPHLELEPSPQTATD